MNSDRRFGGMARLYGVDGSASIAKAHAVIVGVGGVGSWAAESLARSGVGELTLIDMDHVAESNINRQVQDLGATVGMAKGQALRERIADIQQQAQQAVVFGMTGLQLLQGTAFAHRANQGGLTSGAFPLECGRQKRRKCFA